MSCNCFKLLNYLSNQRTRTVILHGKVYFWPVLVDEVDKKIPLKNLQKLFA